MATYNTTPKKAAALLRALPALLEKAALQEQRDSLADAQRLLIQQSSGTVSLAELRRMGHPFARRAPQASPDAAIINDQGGAFRKSWRKVAPVRSGDFVTSRVVNTDPKARFMNGTKTMVKRPIIAAVEAKLKPIRKNRARFYLNQQLQKEMKTDA